MTAKGVYFSFFIGLILLSTVFTGCGVSKSTITYETTFLGFSQQGAHARALYANDKMVVIGGKDGHISMVFFDTSLVSQKMRTENVKIEDFRDVHCATNGNCLFMNAGKNGLIYGISSFGSTLVLFDTTGVFFDGLSFWNERDGILYGDPINGSFFLAKTSNKGRDWQAYTPNSFPKALENEAGFAASGTGIQTVGDSTVYFGTGVGKTARLFASYDQGKNWVAKNTQMRSGDSYGIYSLFFWSKYEGVIVGGSYIDSTFKDGVCQLTTNGGDSWKDRSKGLLGYCSCVHGSKNGDLLVATGRMGTFYSVNKGKSWKILTTRSYYSCNVTDTHIVLSGKNGELEFIKYKRITQ